MNTWKLTATVLMLSIGLTSSGCSTQGELAQEKPLHESVERANADTTVELDIDDIDAINEFFKNIDTLASVLESLQAEGKLDAELDGLWSSVQNDGYQSVALTPTDDLGDGRAIVEQSAMIAFERNLETIGVVLDALTDRRGFLPDSLQEAHDDLSATLVRIGSGDSVEQDSSTPIRVNRLRKTHCCMYFLNRTLVDCREIKALRVGAWFRCTMRALVGGMDVQVEEGACTSQWCEGL